MAFSNQVKLYQVYKRRFCSFHLRIKLQKAAGSNRQVLVLLDFLEKRRRKRKLQTKTNVLLHRHLPTCPPMSVPNDIIGKNSLQYICGIGTNVGRVLGGRQQNSSEHLPTLANFIIFLEIPDEIPESSEGLEVGDPVLNVLRKLLQSSRVELA